jgi:glutamate synthase (NADPH/NADH) small chain
MGKPTGFKEYPRETPARRPVAERINDWFEVYQPFPLASVQTQAARCMDCGVPFCHTGHGTVGCPVNNLIPDWNDLVYRHRWREAIRLLQATNNFPEFTGRICPAPCEASCVLGINEPPVTIKQIEKTIVEHAFEQGWIKPEPPLRRTGKRIAVIGSGPAGLAAAQQLNRAGHTVVVFEKADKIGGLLRYGIPEFKLEKRIVDRRLKQMEEEGVEFRPNSHVGGNVEVEKLRREFDALLIAGGAEQPRDLHVPGRHLNGVHFAMEYLPQANRRAVGERVASEGEILATGKRVLIIGGGDTGADCLGTAIRQKCADVKMWELLAQPGRERPPEHPWPLYPRVLRVESAHEEWTPDPREYAISATKLVGDGAGNVRQVEAVRVGPPPKFEPIPGSEFTMDVDLVLLAMGFTGPVRNGLLEQLGVELDARGNVATNNYATSVPGVFAAGDARRGQSLVVWAIREGREAAEAINASLARRTAEAAA